MAQQNILSARLFRAPQWALLLLLSSFVPGGLGATILSDDASSLSTFSVTGDVIVRISGCYSGSCLRMDGDAGVAGTATRSIDASGFSSIQVAYAIKTSSLENGDSCTVEYSVDGGASYTQSFAHTGQNELSWTPKSISLPYTADNNANVLFRLRSALTSADYCWLDSISVTGTSGSAPTPNPTDPPAPTNPPAPTVATPTPAPGPASCVGCLPASSYGLLGGSGSVARTELGHALLAAGPGALGEPGAVLHYDHMALPAQAAMPLHAFEGTFALLGEASNPPVFVKHKDTFNYDADAQRLQMPKVSVELVAHGSHLLPKLRGSRAPAGGHPFWELVVEPGRCWSESGDNGDSRCALPFALTQRNANCAHNGVLMFTFNDAGVSSTWRQISSETCLYYKFDFSGLAAASYTHAPVVGAQDVRDLFEVEVLGRLPSQPLSALPTVDAAAGTVSGGQSVDLTHHSAYGVLYNDVHYYGENAPTRGGGAYPYREALVVPSYSTAKTFFVGAAVLALAQAYPNQSPSVLDSTISSLVPEAVASGNWDDVTVAHAADMATANYNSPNYMADENLLAHDNPFFLAETHSSKLAHSVNFYDRQTTGSGPPRNRARETPGTTWVYHTTDHYLLLRALQQFLRNASGDANASILQFMVDNVWGPMGGSETLFRSRVTLDADEQPFGAWGLYMLPNDAARLMQLYGSGNGMAGGVQRLDPTLLSAATAHTCPNNCGLVTSATDVYYKLGMWKTAHPSLCDYAAFASGYGGISIALSRQGNGYYEFADDEEFVWVYAMEQIEALDGSCLV